MYSSWVILSLISAFTLATSDALTKKVLSRSNEYIVAWLRLVFSLPLLFVSLLFIPLPGLDKYFYIAFFVSLPLEIFSIILYMKALRLSPLSITLPFLALTPVFLIFGATFFAAIVLLFTPIALYKGRGELGGPWGRQRFPYSLLLPGIFYSLMVVSHMVAMSLAKVAYVISVKRMSLLIGVFYGYLFFREENIRERFLGAVLMFAGFIMVVT